MMHDEHNYVLFTLSAGDTKRYAFESMSVDRIVQLPALTEIPDAPSHLAGVFDLAGTLIPVLDLSALLKMPPERYSLRDVVVVLRGDGRQFGIIVNSVTDLHKVSGARPADDSAGPGSNAYHGVIRQALRLDGGIVLLPDCQALSRYAEAAEGLLDWSVGAAGELSTEGPPASPRGRLFCQDTSPEEAEVFRERARSLACQTKDQDQSRFMSLVTVALNGECFGLPLECVREFCVIRNIVPVPCSPEHIVGNMNTRGEILTVIDVRPLLGMRTSSAPHQNAVIVEQGGFVVGIGVDEIYDVVYVDRDQMTRLPVATGATASEYLEGAVMSGSRVLTVLNLPKLFASQTMTVNEES